MIYDIIDSLNVFHLFMYYSKFFLMKIKVIFFQKKKIFLKSLSGISTHTLMYYNNIFLKIKICVISKKMFLTIRVYKTL